MDREQVAFYAGLAIVVVGLVFWAIRPNGATGRAEIEFAGAKFSLDVPALAVMIIGIALMLLSPGVRPLAPAPAPASAPPPPPIKKIVCTGQYEGNCPGAHDIFYTCGYYGSDTEIAAKVCQGIKAGALRLKTVGGNKCGYALIEVTCAGG